MADQVAWIVLAVLLSGLLIALAKGGWTGDGGARQWFRSKFMGRAT